MTEATDQVARDKANAAAHELKNHIMVTGIKLEQLDQKIEIKHNETNGKVDELKSFLKWVGSLIVTLFLATLSWSLAQQYNSNESTKKDLQAQVELLREQQRNSAAARIDRQTILDRLPSSGTESSDTTERRR